MFAATNAATLLGVDGQPVTVEVYVSHGLPSFTIVGQPDGACRESRDRVRAAINSIKLKWPDTRITVNLAPSGIRKVGAGLDLAIAVGVLVASDQLKGEAYRGLGFVGELGLDGTVRPVPGVLSCVDALGTSVAVVAAAAAAEARLVGRCEVRPVKHFNEVVAALSGEGPWPDVDEPPIVPGPMDVPDLADVRGQPVARRALEVAAAGGHHLLMVGPPGAGKTMLASRLPGILSELDGDAAFEVTRIHSAAGLDVRRGLIRRPPFRAPHHSCTTVALVGGGSQWLRPGEISLAHGGVLFLDEMGEFAPAALDALRQPLEAGHICIARARASAKMPARFLLVAATNPCPCGPPADGPCRCSEAGIARYERRLSGPLLDRFDLRIAVGRPDPDALFAQLPGEASALVAARVAETRKQALERQGVLNARLGRAELDVVAPLSPDGAALLESRVRRGRLSARGLNRVRAVARTLSDLAGCLGTIEAEHVGTALAMREATAHRAVAA